MFYIDTEKVLGLLVRASFVLLSLSSKKGYSWKKEQNPNPTTVVCCNFKGRFLSLLSLKMKPETVYFSNYSALSYQLWECFQGKHQEKRRTGEKLVSHVNIFETLSFQLSCLPHLHLPVMEVSCRK